MEKGLILHIEAIIRSGYELEGIRAQKIFL